jgi:hypothetical protein
MADVNATTLENSRLSGNLEEALLRLKQLLVMVNEAVGHGATPAWVFTVDSYVDAIDDAFNRLLKYCCPTRKMTTLRVPHPLPGSK